MMSKLKKLFLARWFFSLIGIISLSIFIWFIGPLISIDGMEIFKSVYVRGGIIAFVFIVWMIFNLNINLKSSKKEKETLEEILVEDDSESQNEVALLKERLESAIKTISKKKSLRDIPWYMMIGAPGAGKSSIINNSGLEFPLRNKGESGFVDGIGGTSHCDWWFSEQCVFLDTAGRYTTQDSNVNVDSKSWHGLLGLLKKYRTGRPINGVIVTISLASLVNQTKSESNILARDIKARIHELRNKLGLHFPVYVVLTKLDLLDGFKEFFDDLSDKEREEFLGFVLPDDSNFADDKISLFNKEFHDLIVKLDQRMLSNLHAKSNIEERNLAFQFPKQLRSVQAKLDDLLHAIFSENKFEEPVMIRGVFLTSTSQESKTISAINTYGGQRRRSRGAQLVGEPISYFVKDIFDSVIFKESLIGGMDAKKRRKLNLTSRLSFVASAIVLSLMSYLWVTNYREGVSVANDIEHKADQVALDINTLNDFEFDIEKSVSVLNRLLDISTGLKKSEEDRSWLKSIGIHHDERLVQGAKFAYNTMLMEYYSAFIADVLSQELTKDEVNRDQLYVALKVYLMMADSGVREDAVVLSHLKSLFEERYSYSMNEQLVPDLQTHVGNYLALEENQFVKDETIIANAREILTKIPLSERVYQKMKADHMDSSNLPSFRLTDILSRKTLEQMSRYSGKTIGQGIPGFFTKEGYQSVFLMQLNSTIKETMGETWVYGDNISKDKIDRSLITKRVKELYFIDYIDQWDTFLSDIRLRDAASLDTAIQQARVLSSAEYPVTKLITAVQRELTLTSVEAPGKELLENEAVKQMAKDTVIRNTGSLGHNLRYMDGMDFKVPVTPVEHHFKPILMVSEMDIEAVNSAFSAISTQLKKIGRSGNNSKSAYLSLVNEADSETQFDIQATLKKLPYPFRTWLKGLSTESVQFAKSGSQKHINRVWKSEVYRDYERLIRGRYPFSNSKTKEVSLNDFKEFFGFGGTIDSFYKSYLKQFVDTTGRRWKFTTDIGIDDRSLMMFQRASSIRESFFTKKNELKVEFKLKPIYLDQHIMRFRFALGEQKLTYQHDPGRAKYMKWSKYNTAATVTFTPPNSAREISHSFSGDWGLFRLLDQSLKARPETRDDNIVMIDIKGNKATLELMPTSEINPFWSREMESFRCAPTL